MIEQKQKKYEGIAWGKWRAWHLEEFEGQIVYIVCDNMPALEKMPRGFWKGLYGERVIGIGSAVKGIGEQPTHKGQFMKTVAKSEQDALDMAIKYKAKRIAMICPIEGCAYVSSCKDAPNVEVVTTPEQLADIIFEEYVKVFPQPFKDKQVFITCGGPTFPWREFRDGLLDGHTVLGCTRIIGLCSNFDAYFMGDARGYWEHGHRQEIDEFKGLKYSVNAKWPRDRSLSGGIGGFNLVHCGKGVGLDERPDRLAWNKSSGGCSIDVAVHLGAKRIVLVGYTMKQVNGVTNWYGEAFKDTGDPGLMFMKNKVGMIDNYARPFPGIAQDAKERGIEIINATVDSALDCFPKVPLEELI